MAELFGIDKSGISRHLSDILRFHYAITGKTAAEIVFQQADHIKDNGIDYMEKCPRCSYSQVKYPDCQELLGWRKQIRQLECAVTGYFDYIEDLIERDIAFSDSNFV